MTVGLIFLITACVSNSIQVPTPVQSTVSTPIVSAPPTESKIKSAEPVVTKQPKTEAASSAKETSVQPTPKSSCEYPTGNSKDGQSITVDVCSIQSDNSESISFTYYLGNEKVDSLANCVEGSWTTFPEKQVQRPQSAATQKMLDRVCSSKSDKAVGGSISQRTALIFDPPSNVRISPNGEILCSIKEKTRVTINQTNGDWYNVDICASSGWIKADQLKFE